MRPTINVRQTLNKAALVKAAIAALDQCVLVGIPEDKAARNQEGGAMTNAVLGYVHETGSPKANIPARPFLMPGIKNVQDQAVSFLKAAGTAALSGNEAAVLSNLNKAGLVAVNSVRAVFASNDWTPLAPATLAARFYKENGPMMAELPDGQMYQTRPRRKKGEVATPKRNKTLVVSNQLRKAITYVIRKRGA